MAAPARDPRKKGAFSTINRMGLLLLAQVALSFIWQFPLQMLLALVGVNLFRNALGYQWLSGVLVPLSTALPFAAYLFFRKKDPSDYLKFEKVGFTGGLLCVVAGLGVVLLGNYPALLVQQFLGNFGYESPGSILSQGESLEAILLEIAVTAVLVPFMEEFAFRGVILSALRKYGIGFSIVVSGVLFGLAHLDASSVVFATIAGLVFGFLYAKTNNLWLTVLIHALNNLIAVLGSHGEFLFGSQANLVGNLIMLVPMGLGVVALILLLCLKRKMFISVGSPRYDGPAQPLRAGESAGALVRAPVFWVVVGLMVLYTVGMGILLTMLPLAFLPKKEWMLRALELARKLLPLGKSLWVQLWCGKVPSSGKGATGGKPATPRWPTPNWKPSTRPAKPWGLGGSQAVICTSPWSLAPCAPGPSSMPMWAGWFTVPTMTGLDAAARLRTCLPYPTATGRRCIGGFMRQSPKPCCKSFSTGCETEHTKRESLLSSPFFAAIW